MTKPQPNRPPMAPPPGRYPPAGLHASGSWRGAPGLRRGRDASGPVMPGQAGGRQLQASAQPQEPPDPNAMRPGRDHRA